MTRFVRRVDFSSLGVADLIEAREAYHVHLANIENVVGTAIGRYLIRFEDRDYTDPHAETTRSDAERTLGNSGVTPWSWPAVLVFIDEWVRTDDFAEKPEQYIPPRLYLPDGRVVPTCVIKAESRPSTERPVGTPRYGDPLSEPGTALATEGQGELRIGTVGCLVEDGSEVYALTSGHVLGASGSEVVVLRDGERLSVGRVSARAEQRVAFEKAYPGWRVTRGLLNADAGLVRLTSTAGWNARMADGARLGDLIDLGVDTLSLDLIGCPVRGLGAASGEMRGQISGLFYRYRTVGGFDYVADLLIGPRDPEDRVVTQPGDSGSLWCWDAVADKSLSPRIDPATYEPRPIALQWGGHSFLERGGQGRLQIALASSLSTVLRLLDVQLVRDLSFERDSYWGKTGHYKVAQIACELVTAGGEIEKLLLKNQLCISLSDADLVAGHLPKDNQAPFIALADVADVWWRSHRPTDKANHFADLDEPGLNLLDPQGPRKTLMDQWGDPRNRSSEAWNRFYEDKQAALAHRGALPFRAWQGYDLLVKHAKAGDVASFIFVAGTVAHYIGDACQPLHVSRLHHGHDQSEYDVHADYETAMLDEMAQQLVTLVNQKKSRITQHDLFSGGANAADKIFQLMKRCITRVPPERIIAVWKAAAGHRGKYTEMWNALGDDTCDCIVDGAKTLAAYWESAWREGRKGLPALGEHSVRHSTLLRKYQDKTQFESKWLRDMHLPT
jgi:hypothetical protein